MANKTMRVISDVHGKTDEYLKIIADCEYSLQLGDLGFDYDFFEENKVDPDRHKFHGGNHSDMDNYYECPNALGDFGPSSLNNLDFFYVRGSISIDCVPRIKHYILTGEKTWWYEEELSRNELEEAIEKYEQVKPDLMFSHDCPSSIKSMLSSGQMMEQFGWPAEFSCQTQQALEVMLSIHQPKLWCCAHWHRTFDEVINGTRFICMPELGYLDLSLSDDGTYLVEK